MENAQANIDMNRLNELFGDDIPAELRPMTDGTGAQLIEEMKEVATFTAPELAKDPEPSAFHLVQRAMIAAASSNVSRPVVMSLPYIVRATRGYSRQILAPALGIKTVPASVKVFEAWDLVAGTLYPYILTVTAKRSLTAQRITAQFAHSARLLGFEKLIRDAAVAPEAWPFGSTQQRHATALCMETFPPSNSLAALLAVSGRVSPELAGDVMEGVISGLEVLNEDRLVAIVSADCISMSEGLLSGQPILTVLVPQLPSYVNDMKGQVMDLYNRLRMAGGQQPVSATFTNGEVDPYQALRAAMHLPPRADAKSALARAASAARRAAGRPPRLAARFAEDVEVGFHLELECAMCGVIVHSSGHHMHGVDCSHPDQHFMCSDCVNTRVSALLTDAAVDMAELPCPMGCPGVWVFEDFGALVKPQHLRRWQQLSIERTKAQALEAAKEILDKVQAETEATRRDPGAKIVRAHVAAIRKLLRPACPHCALPFESFSGCLSVTCGARDRNGRQISGCGKVFCGGCMTATPCPKNCGHSFVQPGELQRRWRTWRMMRTVEYLDSQFPKAGAARRDESLLRRVLQGVKSHLEIVGSWPLPGEFSDFAA